MENSIGADVISVRFMVPEDLGFIAASWFESYWKATIRPTGCPYEVYKPAQDAIIKRLLARSKVIVITSAAVPDEIVGYGVTEGDVAHYVYVKSAYRRMKIATGILHGRAKWYSHQTKAGRKLADTMGIIHNPYLLMGAL